MSGENQANHTLRQVLAVGLTIVALFALFGWVCRGRIREFALLEDSDHYMAQAEAFIRENEPLQARDLLLGVIDYHRPSDPAPYELLAEAFEKAAYASGADYWRARAEFQRTWRSPTVRTPGYLDEKWRSTIQAGRKVLPDGGLPSTELLTPVFLNTMRKWAEEADSQTARWARNLSAEEMLALLVASGDLALVDEGRIHPEGPRLPVSVLVESSGDRWPGGARITVGDGIVVSSGGEDDYGFYVAYLDPETGHVISEQSFDTVDDPEKAAEMRDLIRTMIPQGNVVTIAVSNRIGPNVDRWVVEETLDLIGVRLPTNGFLRARLVDGAPLAAIGIRGDEPGTGICNIGEPDREKAAILVVPGGR